MRYIAVLILLATACPRANAQKSIGDRFHFSGDFRGRVELDRDSRKSDGSNRADRDRLRVRGRFSLTYAHSDHVQLGWRIRTGDPQSRQSPHVTLGDHFKTLPVALDRLYARVSAEHGWIWFGKNSNPFWHRNELFWDDDVTLEGVAGAVHLFETDGTAIQGRAGYFLLDIPLSNTFSDQTHMTATQLILSGSGGNLSYTVATSYSAIRENPDAEDTRLADLDYSILAGSVSITYSGLSRPIRFGADFARNTETYDTGLYNRDQRAAFVLSAQTGSLSAPRQVLFRVTYAKVEKYAIVGPFAQDDWLRWGSATTTQSSNFKGFEFRAAYAIDKKQNVVARLYTVDGVERESATASALQSGTRFRLDWNIAF